MQILAINGSRRKQGNTAILLQTLLQEAQNAGVQTEILSLGDFRIEACTGCEACRSSWECVIKDDFAQLIDKLDRADAVILASPTYWYSVTSDMKRFVDRCYSLIQFPQTRRQWISKYQNSGKLCICAAVCEQHEEAMMGNTLSLLSDFSKDIGLELLDSLAVLGCFEAGSINNNQTALKQAHDAGQKLLKRLRASL